MSEEERNVSILRDVYEKWNETKGARADIWLNVMADDVDFRSLAEGQENLEFTSRRSAKEEVADYLRGLNELMEMVHYTVDEYVAQGDRVVAIGSTAWRNRRTGKEFETPKVDIIRVRDGKIVEFFELYDTTIALSAAVP